MVLDRVGPRQGRRRSAIIGGVRPRVALVARDLSTPGKPGVRDHVPHIRAGHERFDFVCVASRVHPDLRPLVEWHRAPSPESGAATSPVGGLLRHRGPDPQPPRRRRRPHALLPAGDPEPGRPGDRELVPGRLPRGGWRTGHPVRTASHGARRASSPGDGAPQLQAAAHADRRGRDAGCEGDGRAPVPRDAGCAHTARLRHRALQAGPRDAGGGARRARRRRGRGGRPVRGPQPAHQGPRPGGRGTGRRPPPRRRCDPLGGGQGRSLPRDAAGDPAWRGGAGEARRAPPGRGPVHGGGRRLRPPDDLRARVAGVARGRRLRPAPAGDRDPRAGRPDRRRRGRDRDRARPRLDRIGPGAAGRRPGAAQQDGQVARERMLARTGIRYEPFFELYEQLAAGTA